MSKVKHVIIIKDDGNFDILNGEAIKQVEELIYG